MTDCDGSDCKSVAPDRERAGAKLVDALLDVPQTLLVEFLRERGLMYEAGAFCLGWTLRESQYEAAMTRRRCEPVVAAPNEDEEGCVAWGDAPCDCAECAEKSAPDAGTIADVEILQAEATTDDEQ